MVWTYSTVACKVVTEYVRVCSDVAEVYCLTTSLEKETIKLLEPKGRRLVNCTDNGLGSTYFRTCSREAANDKPVRRPQVSEGSERD
jgi:hypothetical protein